MGYLKTVQPTCFKCSYFFKRMWIIHFLNVFIYFWVFEWTFICLLYWLWLLPLIHQKDTFKTKHFKIGLLKLPGGMINIKGLRARPEFSYNSCSTYRVKTWEILLVWKCGTRSWNRGHMAGHWTYLMAIWHINLYGVHCAVTAYSNHMVTINRHYTMSSWIQVVNFVCF